MTVYLILGYVWVVDFLLLELTADPNVIIIIIMSANQGKQYSLVVSAG